MKRKFILLALPLLLLAACEKEHDRNYYINKTAECCGVIDPMANVPWLREKSRWASDKVFYGSSPFNASILLFVNDSTMEDRIVELQNSYGDKEAWIGIYDCNGEFIDQGHYNNDDIIREINTKSSGGDMLDPCDSCPEFFETHTFVDTLAIYQYM